MRHSLARRRLGVLIVVASCFVLAVCLVLAGAGEIASRRASRDVARILAAHPGMHVAEIDVRASGIELRGIVAGPADRRVTIGRLRLPHHGALVAIGSQAAQADTAAPAAAPPAEGTIAAEDVALTFGATTIRIKHIDMAGTSLTKADLTALLDPKASDGLEARLRKVTAKAVAIPEITIDDTTAGSQRHGLVRDVAFANIVAGKASAASAKDASLALTDGDEAVNLSGGPIEAVNVDLAGLVHVATTRRAGDDEPLKPLLDKLVVAKLNVSNVTRNAGLDIGSITATGVAARPLARALDAVVAAIPGSGADTALFFTDLASSVAVGTLDIADIASHGRSGDDETRISAAQVGVQGVGAGKVGGLHLRDLAIAGSYARLSIGSADVGAFVMPKPGEDARTAARPGTLDVGRVAVEITPRDKPEAKTSFTLDHLALAQEAGSTAIPSSGSASVQNLGFDLAPDGIATHYLYDMGYRHATLSGAFSSSYDAGAQELTIHKLRVGEPAMGSLEVALRLAHVSQDLLSTDPQTVQDAATGVLATRLDLAVVNAGLFEKAIALKAQQDGIGIADERAYGVDFFQNKLPLILGDSAGATTIGKAVARFIAEPKSLHISIESRQGLGIGAIAMLGDPAALLETLDIKATANE